MCDGIHTPIWNYAAPTEVMGMFILFSCLEGGNHAPKGQPATSQGRMERSGMAPWVITPHPYNPSPYRGKRWTISQGYR